MYWALLTAGVLALLLSPAGHVGHARDRLIGDVQHAATIGFATAVLFHNFWSFPFKGEAWNTNFWPFMKNFGLAGAFLYVAADAKMQSLYNAFSFQPR